MTNLLPFAIAWVVLAATVIVLALMRKNVAAHEDDSLHLSAGSAAVAEQVSVAKKLETIDRWGKILTIVLVVSGLTLAIVYGMRMWDESSRVGF